MYKDPSYLSGKCIIYLLFLINRSNRTYLTISNNSKYEMYNWETVERTIITNNIHNVKETIQAFT